MTGSALVMLVRDTFPKSRIESILKQETIRVREGKEELRPGVGMVTGFGTSVSVFSVPHVAI